MWQVKHAVWFVLSRHSFTLIFMQCSHHIQSNTHNASSIIEAVQWYFAKKLLSFVNCLLIYIPLGEISLSMYTNQLQYHVSKLWSTNLHELLMKVHKLDGNFLAKYHALTKSPGLTNSTLNCETLPMKFIHFQYASLSNHRNFTHKIYYPYGRVHSAG